MRSARPPYSRASCRGPETSLQVVHSRIADPTADGQTHDLLKQFISRGLPDPGHARSGGDGPLGALDADMLDTHWAVNTRSTIAPGAKLSTLQ